MHNIVVTPSLSLRARSSRSKGRLVAVSLGHDGSLCTAFALNADDRRIVHPGGASFFKTQPDKPEAYRLMSWQNGEPRIDILIRNEPFNITEVQRLNDDVLLVCPRCSRNHPGEPDRNARLYSRAGELKSEFTLGDGIESVQSTAQGVIWVSYFDEGIFGNFGWDDPLGKSGLVAWSSSGEKLYEYKPPRGHASIFDCCALNVMANGDVWCYYDDEFVLVRIRNFEAHDAWPLPVHDARAVAINGNSALLFGSVESPDRLFLLELHGDGTSSIVADYDVILPSGSRLTVDRVAARDSRMLLVSGNEVYETTVQACRGAA